MKKLSKEYIKKLCTAGSYAPSGGNNQPWRVTVKGAQMTISLHPDRTSSFLDVGKLGSLFSIGAFTENVLLTAESIGLSSSVVLKNVNDPNTFNVLITFSDMKKPSKEQSRARDLADVIPDRVTNRRLSDGKIIKDDIITLLKQTAKSGNSDSSLSTVWSYDKKKELTHVLGKADAIRTLHPQLFTEMIGELRYTTDETEKTKDGIDVNTLELPGNVASMFSLLKKYPSIPRLLPQSAFEDMVKPLIFGSSHIACLSSNRSPSPETLFQTGRIMQRVWLTATQHDIAVHPWTILTFFILRVRYFKGEGFSKDHIAQIKQLETKLREIFSLQKTDVPIFLFRLSYAPKPSARSLRLDWTDFTTVE